MALLGWVPCVAGLTGIMDYRAEGGRKTVEVARLEAGGLLAVALFLHACTTPYIPQPIRLAPDDLPTVAAPVAVRVMNAQTDASRRVIRNLGA